MNGTVKTILVFTLIIAIIAWLMGYINFDQKDYENYTFQEQAQIIGSQFNDAVETGTNTVKTLANAGLNTFNAIQKIIEWALKAIEKIGKWLGITNEVIETEDGWIIGDVNDTMFNPDASFWDKAWHFIKGFFNPLFR